MTDLTWHQAYPGGRIVAKLGEIEVGAVFEDPDGKARWSFWLRRWSPARPTEARSVNAAQNAMASAVADWLRAAGLQQVDHG